MNIRVRAGYAALALALLAVSAAPNVCAEDWSWAVEPYVWASSVKADIHSESPLIEGSSEMAFKDILDKLDGSLQLHAEGHAGSQGMFLDFTYLGISEDRRGRFAETETDLDTKLMEAAWIWGRGGRPDSGSEFFLGVRYIDADLKVDIAPLNPEFEGRVLRSGESYLDAMVGGRYTWELSENWYVTARGDASFGETEGAWNASVSAQYRTAKGAWVFGYRHMEAEIEAAGTTTELTMTGPSFGYAFLF